MLDLLAFAKAAGADLARRTTPTTRPYGVTTTLNCGEAVNPARLARDPRNVHQLSEGTLRSRLHERGIRDLDELLGPKLTRLPRPDSRHYTLDDGTTGTVVTLQRDPRNTNRLSRAGIYDRLETQRLRDPAQIFGAQKNPGFRGPRKCAP